MNNDIIFFCLSKLIMSYGFNLEAFGLNVEDKDKEKEKERAVTLIRKWWEEGARTRRCKNN